MSNGNKLHTQIFEREWKSPSTLADTSFHYTVDTLHKIKSLSIVGVHFFDDNINLNGISVVVISIKWNKWLKP